jgi:hypothetical protein
LRTLNLPRIGVRLLVALALIAASACARAATVAVPAIDRSADATPLIRQKIQEAIAAGPGTELILGDQTYSLWPPAGSQSCLVITNAKGLRVRGQPNTLQELFLFSTTRVTDAGVAELKSHLPQLRVVDYRGGAAR